MPAEERVPRCLVCAYVLRDLPSPGLCPECARPFDLSDARTYTDSFPFHRWHFWAPGLALGAGAGFFLIAFLALVLGDWGGALWLGVPFSVGCILGYRCRVGRAMLIMLALAATFSLIFSAITLNLAGVFCGMILAGIMAVPMLIGTFFGASLRHTLKRTAFSQREYLPVLAFIALPVLWSLLDPQPESRGPERVSTSIIIDAPAERAWNAVLFYEDVEHPPPLLLRIGLARPLSTTGSAAAPGDTKVCIYNKGRIDKRILEVDAPRRLAFEITRQEIGYERDLRLLGGSFDFEPLGPGRTRVTLTSNFRPLLAPRFCWRWGERIAFHTLHHHVLEGMRRRAEHRPLARAGGAP